MKFTVELDDFYLDEEEDLIPALKNEVIGQVTEKIWNRVREKVESSVVDPLIIKIKNNIDQKINEMMMEKLTAIMETETFKPDRYRKEMTYREYIEAEINNANYGNLTNTVKEFANKRADEIKNRYDLVFASQIVSKLNANGMLKEDVAKLLIENK